MAKFSSKRSETEDSEQTEVDDSGAESPPQVSQPPTSRLLEQTPSPEPLIVEKPASPAEGKIRAVNEMKLNSQEMESQTTPATQMKAQLSAETPTTAKQDEDMKLAESQLPQPENSNLLTDSGSLCDEQKPQCLEPGTSPRSLAPSSHSEETKLKQVDLLVGDQVIGSTFCADLDTEAPRRKRCVKASRKTVRNPEQES